jgi:hypothetical protein
MANCTGRSGRRLVRPEVLESGRRQFCVAQRVPNILVTEVALDRPCVLTGIGQLVSGGVADHVRMDLEGEPSLLAGSLHHPIEAVPGERSTTTFGREHECRLRLLFFMQLP